MKSYAYWCRIILMVAVGTMVTACAATADKPNPSRNESKADTTMSISPSGHSYTPQQINDYMKAATSQPGKGGAPAEIFVLDQPEPPQVQVGDTAARLVFQDWTVQGRQTVKSPDDGLAFLPLPTTPRREYLEFQIPALVAPYAIDFTVFTGATAEGVPDESTERSISCGWQEGSCQLSVTDRGLSIRYSPSRDDLIAVMQLSFLAADAPVNPSSAEPAAGQGTVNSASWAIRIDR